MNRRFYVVFSLLAILLLYGLGVGMRRAVLNDQYQLVENRLPFTLESALQFRMFKLVYETGELPKLDDAVQIPDGVEFRKTYSVGAEYPYVWLAKMMPDGLSLEEKARWVSLLIFCLGIPAIMLYAGITYRSMGSGLIAGAFYAVSISAIVRATGQELSRENFALPFMIAFLAFDMCGLQARTVWKQWVYGLLSALCLSIAMMTWDLIQFMLGLWLLWQFIRICFSASDSDQPKNTLRLLLPFVALLTVSIANPYLNAHGFYMSPGMAFFGGLVLAIFFKHRLKEADSPKRWLIRGLPVALTILVFVIAREYQANYSHFAELMKAKLLFMNVKPVDPELLTYDQRIMWTPALNSSTWRLTKLFFPAILLLSLVGSVVLIMSRGFSKTKMSALHPVFYFGFCLLTYILFFRFHVFLVIFMSVVLAGWYGAIRKQSGLGYWVSIICLLVGGGLETANVFFDLQRGDSRADKPVVSRDQELLLKVLGATNVEKAIKGPRWVRPNTYFSLMLELTDWLEANAEGASVLANFGVSGPILAYGGCPIVLHPKFENPEIRNRVRAYSEKLFNGTERELRDWVEAYGAEYYVYSLGEFSNAKPNLSQRYMVNALDPHPDAPARIFEYNYLNSRYFRFVWGNYKYRVFKIIRAADESMAKDFTDMATLAFGNGDLKDAQRWAMQALSYDWQYPAALDLVKKVTSLQRKNFGYEPPSLDNE